MTLRLDHVQLPLDRFTLEIDATLAAPTTGIFGPSGAGKTSLLDLIAGLRKPRAGRVQLGDTLLAESIAGLHVPPRRRRIGYVPQDLALFPHLNVRSNLLYGHRPQAAPDPLFAPERVIEVMEIAPLLGRDVTTLSGGEQQRVALARALLSAPRLLLLDEPMSSLDTRLKARLIPYLQRIRDEFRIPLIYVTHDARELQSMCEEVLILEGGRMSARGPAAEALKSATPTR